MRITFTMSKPQDKKNSTRFDIEKVEVVQEVNGAVWREVAYDTKRFKPSFYVPKPFAEDSKRIRVTVEEL